MSWNLKSSLIITVLAASLTFAGPYWSYNPVNQNWNDPCNWDTGVPNSGRYSSINNTQSTGKFPIISTGTAASNDIYVGHLADGYLSQTGGTLTCVNLLPGYGPGMTGEVSFSGGTATVTMLYVAGAHYAAGLPTVGTVDVNGTAAVTVTNRVVLYDDYGGKAGGVVGTLNLYGGTLTTPDLRINNTNCTPLLNITGGILYWTGGYWTGAVQAFINSGWIKGYGSSTKVLYEYDVANNRTKVWATPTEPPPPPTLKKGVYSTTRMNLTFDNFVAGTNLPLLPVGTGGWYGDPCTAVVIADSGAPSQANCASFVRGTSSKGVTYVFVDAVQASDELVTISFSYKRLSATDEIFVEFGNNSNSSGGPWIGVRQYDFLIGNSTATNWDTVLHTNSVNQWEQVALQIDNATNLGNLFLVTSGGTTLLAKDKLVYEPTGDLKVWIGVAGVTGDQTLIDNLKVVGSKKYYASDFNQDGVVDLKDLKTFAGVWLNSTAP